MDSNNRSISKNISFGRKYKWVLTALKYILVGMLIYLIYSQLSHEAISTQYFIDTLSSTKFMGGLALVFTMMLINWHLEVTKWRVLVGKFESINYKSALKSISTGIALAIVTPGRIGEYGGRLISISNKNKPKALLATAVNSVAQNIANVSFGLIGMIFYAYSFLEMGPNTTIALCGIVLPILFLGYGLLYRLDLVDGFLSKYEKRPWVKWILKHSAFLASYTSKEISTVLYISILRYSVYVSQYVILVLLCGVTANPIYALMGVVVIFFIQSGVPLPPMLSILARGEIAIWVWSVFTGEIAAILLATFLLWVINLIIPALVGTGYIWSTDIEEVNA